jgi:AcrR family transcriptional regulator
MSTLDRKAREREELRNLILTSAQRQFVKNGIEQTTIRNIADAIDYSIGTVYKYFKDKNAILHALHSQGFQDLGTQFTVLYNVKNPLERLKAMGKVYITFAMQNPDMYDLMFNMKAPIAFLDDSDELEWNEGKTTFNVLRNTVKECIAMGHFTGHEAEPLSFLIWSCVHGMCSLKIRERTKGVSLLNPDTIVDEGYDEFLKIVDRM